MALKAFGATVNQALGLGADYDIDPAGAGNQISTTAVTTAEAAMVTDVAAIVADAVTVASNVATLVADGASPTQAHVTTLNTHWGTLNTDIGTTNTDWATLKTALDALVTAAAGAAANPGNVTLIYDTAVVTNKRQLMAAVRNILRQIDGAGLAP